MTDHEKLCCALFGADDVAQAALSPREVMAVLTDAGHRRLVSTRPLAIPLALAVRH
jgi:hypothetical protein